MFYHTPEHKVKERHATCVFMTGTLGDTTPPSHGTFGYEWTVRSVFPSESCEGGARLPA